MRKRTRTLLGVFYCLVLVLFKFHEVLGELCSVGYLIFLLGLSLSAENVLDVSNLPGRGSTLAELSPGWPPILSTSAFTGNALTWLVSCVLSLNA